MSCTVGSVCHPVLVEKFHERVINHKGYGYIQAYSTKSGNGPLVEPEI